MELKHSNELPYRMSWPIYYQENRQSGQSAAGKSVRGIVAKKWEPRNPVPGPFSAQIWKFEARLGKFLT